MDSPIGSISADVEVDMGSAAAELARLREELSTTNGLLKRLEEKARDAGDSSQEMAGKLEYLRGRQVELREAVAQLSVAAEAQVTSLKAAATATHTFEVSAASAARQVRGASFAFLEFSRGVEDFSTGGPLGALNNIPQMFMGIGTAAGLSTAGVAALTGGVSLAATAGYLVWRYWDDITGLFSEGETLNEAQRMEKLGKATHRTAEETKELHAWEKKRDELAKLKATEDDAHRTRAKGAKELIERVGGKEVTSTLGKAVEDMDAGNPAIPKHGEGAKKWKAKRAKELDDLLVQFAEGDAQAGFKVDELLSRPAVKDTKFAHARRVQVGHEIDPMRVGDGGDFERKKRQAEELDKLAEETAKRYLNQIGPEILKAGSTIQDEEAALKAMMERADPGKARDPLLAFKAAWAAREIVRKQVTEDAAEHGGGLDAARARVGKELVKKRDKPQTDAEKAAGKEFDRDERAALKDERGRERAVNRRARQFEPAYSKGVYGAMEAKADDATIGRNLKDRLATDTDIPPEILAEVAERMVRDARKKFEAALIQSANERSRKPLDRLLRPQGGRAGLGLAAPVVPQGEPPAAPLPARQSRASLLAARKAAVLAAAKARNSRRRGVADDDADDDAAPVAMPAVAAQRARDEAMAAAAREKIEAFDEREAARKADAAPMPARPLGKNGLPLPELPPAEANPAAAMIAKQKTDDERRRQRALGIIDQADLREVERKAGDLPKRELGPNGLPRPVGPGPMGIERMREAAGGKVGDGKPATLDLSKLLPVLTRGADASEATAKAIGKMKPAAWS